MSALAGTVDPGHLIEAGQVAQVKDAEPAYKGQTDYVSIIASASTPPQPAAFSASKSHHHMWDGLACSRPVLCLCVLCKGSSFTLLDSSGCCCA